MNGRDDITNSDAADMDDQNHIVIEMDIIFSRFYRCANAGESLTNVASDSPSFSHP